MPTPDAVDLGYAYTLPPAEAIRYFESKGYVIGFNWHDVQARAHAKAFTVAGVLKLDVLHDIRQALTDSLKQGNTYRDFKGSLEPTLEQKGWLGTGLASDPETGELQGKQLAPHRLKTIFETNLQSSYNAGRWAQQVENKDDRPYLERVAVIDNRTRPKHRELNGFIAPIDDPIWDILYPPDGYGCRCRVRSRSQADVDRLGLVVQSSKGRMVEVQQSYGPDTIDAEGLLLDDGTVYAPSPGFGSNPGKVAWQPELDKYDYQSARQYVSGAITGPDFALGLQDIDSLSDDQSYPLAVLSPDQRRLTGTPQQTVSVSVPVMRQLNGNRPLTVADYVLMQLTIEAAQKIALSGRALRYIMPFGKKWSVVTVEDNRLKGWDIVDKA